MSRKLPFAVAFLAIGQITAAQSYDQPAAPPPAAAPAAAPEPTAVQPAPAASEAPAAAAAAGAAAAPAAAATPAAAPAAAAPAAAAPAAAAPASAPPPPPQPAAAAQAQPAEKKAPRGQLYTWGAAGTTFANGETYGNVSVGAGYLLKSGITPNAELSYNFGTSPTFWALRPGVTWFLPVPRLRPYLGAYYVRWFVGSGESDQNGVGGRLGFSLGRVISIGATYERLLNCSQHCDSWSPQVSAGISM